MQQPDPSRLFSRAEQAFQAGRLDAARADLVQVTRMMGEDPAVLHLTGLVEKGLGDLAAARHALFRAAVLAPRDPQIRNNFANLLMQMGELHAALSEYDKAIAAAPGHAGARLNRVSLLQRMGRHGAALEEAGRVVAAEPHNPAAHNARGISLRALDRLDEAADAFDAALAIAPDRLAALHGRARVALERGEAAAVPLYRKACSVRPDDPEILLGLAQALEVEGNPEGVELLTQALPNRPGWLAGYEELARMRSEAGETKDFTSHYRAALADRPGDLGLHQAYWRSLAKAERYGEALAAIEDVDAKLRADPSTMIMEALYAGENGEVARATRLFARLEGEPGVDLTKARHLLRVGDAAHAAALLEPIVERDKDDIVAWSLLGLAWRQEGDPRHHWLSEQPGLYGSTDLPISPEALDCLAEVLRGLHRARSHPIGQSLRGGTQTRGALLRRREPEIAALRGMLQAAVEAHLTGLPPQDERHPLLRHRGGTPAFSGSWSVRLSGQGFHVNHIHPAGALSSACYIALPDSLGSDASRDGWLEIGTPPSELALGLGPLASIEPRPGRLALFPSYLYHGTRPFAQGERLTVAFDVVVR